MDWSSATRPIRASRSAASRTSFRPRPRRSTSISPCAPWTPRAGAPIASRARRSGPATSCCATTRPSSSSWCRRRSSCSPPVPPTNASPACSRCASAAFAAPVGGRRDSSWGRARRRSATAPTDERLAGLQSLRIGRVRRTGRAAPRFELVPGYAPPAISVQAAPVLLSTVNEILERLCAASRTFGQFRRERGPEAVGYGVGDFEQLLARQVLNQYIPALQHALVDESLHPYRIYGLLAELRGALTSYFPEEDPTSFPPYDHDDLGGCYGTIAEHVRRLLERLLPMHYVELPLTRDENQFSTPLDESLFSRGMVWVLALQGGGGEEGLRPRIE